MPRTKTDHGHYLIGETFPRLTSILLTPCHFDSELQKPLTQLRQMASVKLTVRDAETLFKQSANLDEAFVSLSHLLATRLPVAFCRLLLAEKDQRLLTPKAAHSVIGCFDGKIDLSDTISFALLPDGTQLAHLHYRLVGPYRELSSNSN